MKIIYFVALPAIVIIIGLFLVVSEISKALERSVGKLGAFNDLRLKKDPVLVFSVLNNNLLENQSIFELNFTNAQANIEQCDKLKVEMKKNAMSNDEGKFTANARIYEKAHCAE
jgi:hypothetical protein